MTPQLEDISGIGKATAERLKNAGIDTIEKLATSKIEDLLQLNIKGIGKATLKKYVENAKEIYENSSEKLKVKQVSKTAKKVKKIPEKVQKTKISKGDIPKSKANIKNQLKKQAECNIGLVGHVDHGKRMLIRHFP